MNSQFETMCFGGINILPVEKQVKLFSNSSLLYGFMQMQFYKPLHASLWISHCTVILGERMDVYIPTRSAQSAQEMLELLLQNCCYYLHVQ